VEKKKVGAEYGKCFSPELVYKGSPTSSASSLTSDQI
jgi:hypothetical protein